MSNFIKFIILLTISIQTKNCIGIDTETIKMRELAAELRCVVCQNQSLLESDSELAKDLKSLILEMYLEGKSKNEIKAFLVDRYGEFILFKPKLNANNLVLWLAPIFSLFLIIFLAYRNFNFNKRKK